MQKTIDELGKSYLDSQALKLVHTDDIATLDLTLDRRNSGYTL